jgi:purine-nucleoside phosphorylase
MGTITPSKDLSRLVDETAAAVRAQVDISPHVGVVLGSGLGGFAERLRKTIKIPYRELPHMPVPTVAGHAGNLCVGYVDDVPVVCMEGRVHLYEGHPAWQVVHGVRVMAQLGVRAVLLTNAAGAVEPSWTEGTLMVVVDHVDLMAHEPLVFGRAPGTTPFPAMRDAYDPALREELHEVAHAESLLAARIQKNAPAIELEEGVYAALRDPSCETPAMVKMLSTMGVSAVGMSTVPEVTALRQMGVRVAALSYVSHHAAGVGAETLDDETTSRWGLSHFERIVRAHRA